uniref:Uncharacterized protein n=1 Tax=Babesia bovis TaxID=5865 RepID=S6BKI3_BABBO|nr:hypothetical protein [Babesia bovis]
MSSRNSSVRRLIPPLSYTLTLGLLQHDLVAKEYLQRTLAKSELKNYSLSVTGTNQHRYLTVSGCNLTNVKPRSTVPTDKTLPCFSPYGISHSECASVNIPSQVTCNPAFPAINCKTWSSSIRQSTASLEGVNLK